MPGNMPNARCPNPDRILWLEFNNLQEFVSPLIRSLNQFVSNVFLHNVGLCWRETSISSLRPCLPFPDISLIYLPNHQCSWKKENVSNLSDWLTVGTQIEYANFNMLPESNRLMWIYIHSVYILVKPMDHGYPHNELVSLIHRSTGLCSETVNIYDTIYFYCLVNTSTFCGLLIKTALRRSIYDLFYLQWWKLLSFQPVELPTTTIRKTPSWVIIIYPLPRLSQYKESGEIHDKKRLHGSIYISEHGRYACFP